MYWHQYCIGLLCALYSTDHIIVILLSSSPCAASTLPYLPLDVDLPAIFVAISDCIIQYVPLGIASYCSGIRIYSSISLSLHTPFADAIYYEPQLWRICGR